MLRVQTATDVVYNFSPSNPGDFAGFVAPGTNWYDVVDTVTKTMPRTEIVNIGIQDAFGGHSNYFDDEYRNSAGVKNWRATVEAFWDEIK